MSKDYLFSKKGKKRFNKLSGNDKMAVAEYAMQDAVNKALSKHIPNAIVRGGQLKMHSLYEKYVQRIDSGTLDEAEQAEEIDKILSEIRTAHLEFLKMMERK